MNIITMKIAYIRPYDGHDSRPPCPKRRGVHIMHTLWQHTALDEDEGDVHTVNTPSGAQEMSIIRVSAEMQGCSYCGYPSLRSQNELGPSANEGCHY